MKRTRILPLGTPDEPQRLASLQPSPRRHRSLADLAMIALAVLVLALAGAIAAGGWPW